jgi:Putative adhesin
MPTFVTPEPIAATVEVAGAQVRVTASDRADTVVLVEPINEASRSDVKVASKTRVDFAGGQLSVKTTTPGDKSGSVAITIDLPAGSSLAAYLAHSSVQADGPVGRCELHLASGQVRLDRIDALQASIASGEVVIGHIAGRASIDGGAFAMRIGEAEGTVGLSSSGGQAWIGHASGDLDLSSGHGDFDIDRADGSITATTANGAIRIGQMTHGQAKLTSGSGNIEVGISEGAAASIDAGSERGAVHNFVSPPGNSDLPDHKVMVHARTRHGDIIIQRAAS